MALRGFRRRGGDDHPVWVAEALEAPIEASGLLEPGAFARALAGARGPSGRALTAVLRLPGASGCLHLRPLRRGGWLAPLRGDTVTDLRRPLDELRVTSELRSAGVPVPSPALLIAQREGRSWRAAVGTRFEEDTCDARVWLEAAPGGARVERAAHAAGVAVRRLHDAGARHRDLHAGNLLVRERGDDVEVIVVDLDRATLGADVPPRRRMHELMRLHRSLVKRGLVDRVGPRGYARFLASYTDGDRSLRAALKARRAHEQHRLLLHTLGYRLFAR